MFALGSATLSPFNADKRHETDVGNVQLGGKLAEVGADLIKDGLIVVNQVHLVDGQNHVLDAQQRNDERVTFGLRQDAFAGVDQNDRQVGRRRTGRHVASELLVTWRIGDDELSLRSREVAIGHIDRDSLLTFVFQSVQQQRGIDLVAVGAVLLAIFAKCRDLIVVDRPGFQQQPPISVLLPSSTLPQVMNRSSSLLECSARSCSPAISSER